MPLPIPRELPVIKACFSLDVISETSSVLVWLIGPLVTRSFYVIGLVSIGPSFNLPLQLVGTRELSSPAAQEGGAESRSCRWCCRPHRKASSPRRISASGR